MNALVVDILDLPRQVGAVKDVHVTLPAPQDLGTEVMAARPGSPVGVTATLTSVEDGVLVRGSAHLELEGQCVRCLRDLSEERTVTFDELYLTAQAAARQAADGDEEAADLFQVGDTSLDLEPAVRDALVLGLPFQPLCRPECPGLCPQCGERLDDLPADHHHELVDPRWSALASLLDHQPNSAASGQPAATSGAAHAASDAAGGQEA